MRLIEQLTRRRIFLFLEPERVLSSKSIAMRPSASWAIDLELRGHEAKRNNCFSKMQLVGQKYRDQTT